MSSLPPPDPVRYLWLFLRDLMRKILEGPPPPPPPGDAASGKVDIQFQNQEKNDG